MPGLWIKKDKVTKKKRVTTVMLISFKSYASYDISTKDQVNLEEILIIIMVFNIVDCDVHSLSPFIKSISMSFLKIFKVSTNSGFLLYKAYILVYYYHWFFYELSPK